MSMYLAHAHLCWLRGDLADEQRTHRHQRIAEQAARAAVAQWRKRPGAEALR